MGGEHRDRIRVIGICGFPVEGFGVDSGDGCAEHVEGVSGDLAGGLDERVGHDTPWLRAIGGYRLSRTGTRRCAPW